MHVYTSILPTIIIHYIFIIQWSAELQEQEKVFLEQAQLVNQWDRILTDNGDKVRNVCCEPLNEDT